MILDTQYLNFCSILEYMKHFYECLSHSNQSFHSWIFAKLGQSINVPIRWVYSPGLDHKLCSFPASRVYSRACFKNKMVAQLDLSYIHINIIFLSSSWRRLLLKSSDHCSWSRSLVTWWSHLCHPWQAAGRLQINIAEKESYFWSNVDSKGRLTAKCWE